jgi:putative Holliday junction resolvase
MRHLGIDYGTRRIGLALSDEGGRFATPLEVIEVSTPQNAIDRICRVADSEAVVRVVVGLPLNMDGSEGAAAAAVRRWAATLADRSGRELLFVDERLSSFEADQTLQSRRRAGERLTHRGKKRRLDALAAAQLLQAYLDGALKPLGGPN